MDDENQQEFEDNMSANLNAEICKLIIEQYYELTATSLKKLDGYDDLNFHVLPPIERVSGDRRDDIEIWPHGYVLKIINKKDSENSAFINEYIKVLLHLSQQNICCPRPIKNKHGDYFSYWSDSRAENVPTPKHVIILLTYQPGKELEALKCNETIAFSLGEFISSLHLHLQAFKNSEAFKRPDFSWNLEAAPKILDLLDKIHITEEQKNRVLPIIDEFKKDVLTRLDAELEKGVIHNDLNDRNILVRSDEKGIILLGLIDFADMVHTAYLFEIAILICYLCVNNPEDPIKLMASLLKGYKRRRLTDVEFKLLKTCICARLSQSLIWGLYSYSLNPANEYVLGTQKVGWNVLYFLQDMNNEHFVNELHRVMNSNE